MNNKETLQNTRNLVARLLATLDAANQLPEDDIESLSLFAMRIDFDKPQTGLIEDIYELEEKLHAINHKGKQK